MNAVSADEDGAGLENLPPNGAPEGRVTGMGRHPARSIAAGGRIRRLVANILEKKVFST